MNKKDNKQMEIPLLDPLQQKKHKKKKITTKYLHPLLFLSLFSLSSHLPLPPSPSVGVGVCVFRVCMSES